ncbi:hypothetical protein B7Z00_01875 [Candidatus Saccharibacteria bacterium 32-50-10]|nr:MAG: hypothetical protein B7Z00_01875 [Candidatus Saccharibacteria bacterium 32-50-10]
MRLKFWQKLKQQIVNGNEKGAREAVLEDLFNDFNRNRYVIYKMNFFRGVFFGFGSVLGGTVVVALVIWLLNATGQLIPGVAGFVESVVELMQ